MSVFLDAWEQPLGEGGWWVEPSKQWLRDNYWIPTTAAVVYVIFVFGMQRYLAEKDDAARLAWVQREVQAGRNPDLTKAPTYSQREPAWVKPLMFLWNMSLGLASMVGLYFSAKPIWQEVQRSGISGDLCNTSSEVANPWIFIFVFSKIIELGDTVFLVMRRREVPLLHWYHHMITIFFVWNAWAEGVENGSWFCAINLFVHSIMYPYFALTSFVRFPNIFRAALTSIQLIQMVIGAALIAHNVVVCPNHIPSLVFMVLVYLSFVVLFGKLFWSSYCVSRPRSSSSNSSRGAVAAARASKAAAAANGGPLPSKLGKGD